MGALPTMETPLLDRPHLIRLPASEHLGYEASIVTRFVARVGAGEPVPVLGKDLFEDVPGRRHCCSHQAASLRSVGLSVIALFYHIPSTISTPSSACPGVCSPTSLAFELWGRQGNPQMEIPMLSSNSAGYLHAILGILASRTSRRGCGSTREGTKIWQRSPIPSSRSEAFTTSP